MHLRFNIKANRQSDLPFLSEAGNAVPVFMNISRAKFKFEFSFQNYYDI